MTRNGQQILMPLILMVMLTVSTMAHETQTDPPLPFAFSISGGSNAVLNPWKDRVVNFHISLFSGQVHGVDGMQIGLISNRVTGDFHGYDATGISSRIDGNFNGFQAGALSNNIGGNFIGMQSGGIYNKIGSNYFGMQSAGIVNVVGESFIGMQTGGIFNKVGGDFLGLQTSGIFNEVDGDFTGLQISGIRNESGNIKHVQISGVSNKAEDVEGVQIAGIVNKAGHVRGVQIGLVNRSEELDGIALGLVNLSESGSVHIVSWASDMEDYQVGIKFAPNDYWFTILTIGQQMHTLEEKQLTSFETHMGFHLPLVAKFFTEIDLGTGNTIPNDFFAWESNDYERFTEARISLGLQITPRLSIFAGLSNRRTYDNLDSWSGSTVEARPFFGIQI